MKAVYFEEHGGPEVLKIGELETPVAGPGEVLIDVHATSMNHLDIFVRRGLPGMRLPLPHVPGCDAAGRVSVIGDGVTGVAVGDRVLVNPSITCGTCELCVRGDASMCRRLQIIGEHIWGGCAEQLVVPQDNAIKIPDHFSYEEAAAVPMVFVTAWRMLVTRGKIRPAEDVLVLGAAAGVGSACIQIARHAGARVIAAAGSDDKLEFCRKLGADVVINYKKEDFLERVRVETGKRGVDVCVDYVGKDTWVNSLKSLARGGRLLTCGATTGYDPQTDIRYIFYNQLEVIGSTTGTKNELLAPLKLLFRGDMKPAVGKILDLADIAEAHRLMEERQVPGKLVIRVSQDDKGK